MEGFDMIKPHFISAMKQEQIKTFTVVVNDEYTDCELTVYKTDMVELNAKMKNEIVRLREIIKNAGI